MPEAADFYRAIQADPEDPLPRLVYADWLEETGDPDRAEAVRNRVERDAARRFSPAVQDVRLDDLDARHDRLNADHEARWADELPQIAGVQWGRFDGGVVDELSVDQVQPFVAHSAMLLAAQPVVSLRPPGMRTATLRAIFDATGIERLGGLRILNPHGGSSLARRLALADRLIGLRSLHLGNHRLGDVGAIELTGAGFAELRVIDLSRNYLGPRGAAALARWERLANLKVLQLDTNPLAAGAVVLARSPHLVYLRVVNLATCQIESTDFASLIDARPWPELRRLDLTYNPIGGEGLRALGRADHWSHLTHLKLAWCAADSLSFGRFARSPHLTSLESLELAEDDYDSRMASDLVGAAFWPTLTRLNLDHNRIGPSGVQAITRAANRLEVLRLDDTELGDLGAHVLADSGRFRDLIDLALWGNAIGDFGAEAIARSGGFSMLRKLGLGRNSIGDPGAIALARSPHLNTLTALNLRYNPISNRGALALAEAMAPGGPLANLRHLGLARTAVSAPVAAELRDRLGSRIDLGPT